MWLLLNLFFMCCHGGVGGGGLEFHWVSSRCGGGVTEGTVVLEFRVGKLLSEFGLNSNLELVVDEGNDHAVEEGDQV
jgi:hypothetical protein